MPFRLEYFSALTLLGLLAGLGLPIVWLGRRALTGIGPARKWVAIGARLLVLLVMLLLLGGLRLQRVNKDLEVLVLRDTSQSTSQVHSFPEDSLVKSINTFLTKASDDKSGKPPDDRIGVISFQTNPIIDAMPSPRLALDARAIPENASGTNIASAIQLALATFSKDAMHRLVLMTDGNNTQGDLDAAISAAAAQKVPIDVMPLRYDVKHEVLVDKLIAPAWKRENEPFTLDVKLTSTNDGPVEGNLTVLHQGLPMDLDPTTDGMQTTRTVKLQKGSNIEHVRVPALASTGVHQFRAIFDAPNVATSVPGQPADADRQGDTIAANNFSDAFTFVRGRGQILYVDNVPKPAGDLLAEALNGEGINVTSESHISVEQFPTSLVQLQNYDAVILSNVPRGAGGLSEAQQKMLAGYVHDMGGGLVMIGGPDAFGAGGWQGSDLEQVLPVNMDIPAERQLGKGALVLIMHSCEMPDGNYWGEQCAIKAIETLSAADEIGVISYGWNNGGAGWDFPLAEKGDGSKVIQAVKKMQLGDMPSFDDAMNVAMNGINGGYCLAKSNAKQKHVIIISDGDPAPPQQALFDQYLKEKVSASTVTVFTHEPGKPAPNMIAIAEKLKGKVYGPIESNPNQLPQIFIKEATIVRRSLLQEDAKGIPLRFPPTSSDMLKGLDKFPPVLGLVLTSKKKNPQIEMPIVAGAKNDPLLAHWQSGLGKAAVFTSDAHNKWLAPWINSPGYAKFWAQVVRSVSRPPMSSDFDVRTTQSGDKGKVVVEALNRDSAFINFLSIRGSIVGPDLKAHDIKLVQTGPGTYQAEFDTPDAGNYVLVLNYRGAQNTNGVLLSGVAMNASPELRDLKSNEAVIKEIAERTGGRMLAPFDAAGADLFDRSGLPLSSSPLPVWDVLLPILLGLVLVDVGVRRIAWDWASIRKYALGVAGFIEGRFAARRVDTRQTLDALRKVREEVAEQQSKQSKAPVTAGSTAETRPDPTAKFEAKGVSGDITQVVGGATSKPIALPPAKVEPKPGTEPDRMSGLLEAKRRAQQQMREKEKNQ